MPTLQFENIGSDNQWNEKQVKVMNLTYKYQPADMKHLNNAFLYDGSHNYLSKTNEFTITWI